MARYIFILILISTMIIFMGCGNEGSDNLNDNQNPDHVTVTINVDNLPNAITYNKSTTPDNYLEYQWNVIFDLNADGVISEGDISLSLSNFKAPGSTEQTGSISNFQANLWIFTSNSSAQEITSAVVNKQIINNSIVLSVNKSADASLGNITNSTLVYFQTTNYGSPTTNSCWDYYPSFQNFVAIPNNKQFTDTQGDVSCSEVDMVTIQLSF